MEQVWFYVTLGLTHVLDLDAYDHILFLAALALPFTFKHWKKILVLATVFTVAHCTSLALSVFEIVRLPVSIIEFLIPVTIAGTVLFNIYYAKKDVAASINFKAHSLATAFFGLIHGFGFSNYFNMLMAEESDKFGALLGFAAGIELAQVLIIFMVLILVAFLHNLLGIRRDILVLGFSILILAITIPLLVATFPW